MKKERVFENLNHILEVLKQTDLIDDEHTPDELFSVVFRIQKELEQRKRKYLKIMDEFEETLT